jgi:hypothetical protein
MRKFRHLPVPMREALSMLARFSFEEFEKTKAGHLSSNMDDKWDIGFEAPWLFICRSWAGRTIYELRLADDGASVVVEEAWVNRDTKQYACKDLDFDRRFALWLINQKLLGKVEPLPALPNFRS